jgi:hypothetical protein
MYKPDPMKRVTAGLRVPPAADAELVDATPRSPMSAEERQVIRALAKCRFDPKCADRRFCLDLAAAADAEHGYILTEGQRAYLRRIGQHYRRQLSAEIVALLEDPSPATAIAHARARFNI